MYVDDKQRSLEMAEDNIMRTDIAIEVLADAYNNGLTLNSIYNKKRNILKKQNMGFTHVIFQDEILDSNDVIYTRIKGYTK